MGLLDLFSNFGRKGSRDIKQKNERKNALTKDKINLTSLQIVVCGGGNGAQTMAAMAGTVTDHVSLYFSPKYKSRADELQNQIIKNDNKLIVHTISAPNPTVKGNIKTVTTDPSAVIPDADVIIISLPGDKHEAVINEIAPYLESQIVCFLPGTSALDLKMIRTALGEKSESVFASGLTYAATKTLPWSTRQHVLGEMHVRGTKGKVEVTVFPSNSHTRSIVLDILDVLHSHPCATTGYAMSEHWLEATYIPYNYCGNPILHSGFMYGMWKDWNGEEYDTPPKFYHGATQEVIDILEGLWNDLKTIQEDLSRALGMVEPPNRLQHLRSMMYGKYEDSITDPRTLLSTFKTNEAYTYTVHPMKKLENGKFVPNFYTRQLTEDIPFGLVPMKGTGDILGTKTPTLDAVLLWAQEKIGKSYMVDGGLTGPDVADSGAPQRFGVTDARDLLLYVPAGVIITNLEAMANATMVSMGAHSDPNMAAISFLSAAVASGKMDKSIAASISGRLSFRGKDNERTMKEFNKALVKTISEKYKDEAM